MGGRWSSKALGLSPGKAVGDVCFSILHGVEVGMTLAGGQEGEVYTRMVFELKVSVSSS